MSLITLTITVDTEGADEETDALSSAISNLEYDGYGVISYREEVNK